MEDVLLIDDDVELCSMLTEYLGRYGFRVTAVHRGDKGLKAARERSWLLVLLDVMLPGMDGFEVLKQLRSTSSVSVLLLTARGDDVDRIVGLEIGADDYLPKPFNPRELLARMRAILRRSATTEATPEKPVLRVDDLELDPAARIVLTRGKNLDLTDVEFSLLEALMRSPGKVVSREELAERVLGRNFSPFDRSLDMHVSRLRRKLEDASSSGDRVKTIRGSGYQLLVHRTPVERLS
ncbi:MAG TPA: response regulator transcription factor [Acidobacteriaceae bacterium]|nr:response regulator transcription factor [Acidobacteriaceae bacterium]